MRWTCREKTLEFNHGPLIMGILNVTPDSFSDGGEYSNAVLAVEHGLRMIKDGADIIDVGGESTKPGAEAVSTDEELKRVIPVIEKLSSATSALISIDTTKAEVADRAIEAGAVIINDVSAMTADPKMIEVARATRAGIVLMHMKGNPRTMQKDPTYTDVVREVNDYLRERVEHIAGQGVIRSSIAIDPGIGFGKTVEHNLRLIAGIGVFGEHGLPVIAGLSRKSFLGRITGQPVSERLPGGLAAMVYSILKGAHVVRVHDVRESLDAIKVLNALENPDSTEGL